jgi:hypothetical protein
MVRTYICRSSLCTSSSIISELNQYLSAPTAVISLENTLHGTIFPQDEIIRISEFAHSKDVKMHLDGARIWHVAAETGTSLKELCDPFDSVSLCLSKGLGEIGRRCSHFSVFSMEAQVHPSAHVWLAPRTSSPGPVGSVNCLAEACVKLGSSLGRLHMP